MAALPKKPIIVQSAYKIIILSLFVGIAVFLISPFKSNEMLIFTFLPLAIMATNEVEVARNKLRQELTTGVFILCALYLFIIQL